MSSNGDCFVVLPPSCASDTVIFGRSGVDVAAADAAQEVHFYEAGAALEGVSDGGAAPADVGDCLRLILQKPRPGVWGGDCGANERNVCVGVSWAADEAENGGGHLNATDILRYTLATSVSAASAVDRIGALTAAHGADNAKMNFVVCDAQEAWSISCGGRLWAAQQLKAGHCRLPHGTLTVQTTMDKSSDGLSDALKTLGLWSGDSELNFAACFGGSAGSEEGAWCGEAPTGDASYSLTSMFKTLRAAAGPGARSATVSVLSASGISCHWFTATPNAGESVFKPFVFAPNPRISPLTKAPAGGDDGLTLLHKLHAQRKPAAVEDLKALEASCVEEVNKYLSEHPEPDAELDELMKDCVEAEVKFYR